MPFSFLPLVTDFCAQRGKFICLFWPSDSGWLPILNFGIVLFGILFNLLVFVSHIFSLDSILPLHIKRSLQQTLSCHVGSIDKSHGLPPLPPGETYINIIYKVTIARVIKIFYCALQSLHFCSHFLMLYSKEAQLTIAHGFSFTKYTMRLLHDSKNNSYYIDWVNFLPECCSKQDMILFRIRG